MIFEGLPLWFNTYFLILLTIICTAFAGFILFFIFKLIIDAIDFL